MRKDTNHFRDMFLPRPEVQVGSHALFEKKKTRSATGRRSARMGQDQAKNTRHNQKGCAPSGSEVANYTHVVIRALLKEGVRRGRLADRVRRAVLHVGLHRYPAAPILFGRHGRRNDKRKFTRTNPTAAMVGHTLNCTYSCIGTTERA